MDAGYFPQRCSLATSCSPACFSPWLLCLPHSLPQKEGPGTGWALWKPLPPRVLLRDCWGSEDSPVCELKPGSWENCCGTTSSFFALLGHHGGSTRAQNFQRQKHPFSMLFIKYRVHFMLLLAQANTFASWHSLRTAVHSIKTGERANVACVPASA